MKEILIIEDERPAAERLIELINKVEPKWKILDVLDSIESSVNYIEKERTPDLIFMDVQLADGFSFEIFKQAQPSCPVIFATAYDQFALDAFKVNGLDYILKPLQLEEVERVISKFNNLELQNHLNPNKIIEMLKKADDSRFKKRFMIKIGDRLVFVKTESISRIISEDGYSFIVNMDGKRYLADQTLEQFHGELDPNQFFQINRKCIINVDCIEEISSYFNKRLKLSLKPQSDEEFIVSRPRTPEFRKWMDR